MTAHPQTLGALVNAAFVHGSFANSTDPDRLDWIVGPVGRHRESALVDECNFDVALSRFLEVDPDGVDHDVIRFGHFAVGWIEELITRPGSRCAELAAEMRAALDTHPVLDDDALSERECELESDNWPEIIGDLRRNVAAWCKQCEDDETWINLIEDEEQLSDGALDDVQRDVTDGGETGNGWRRWSRSAVMAIRDRIIELHSGAS